MDRLVYFLLGLIIGAFNEPTLALLCRDLSIWFKLWQLERLEKRVLGRVIRRTNEANH